MAVLIRFLIFCIFGSLILGCATTTGRLSRYHNGALENLDPAPESMGPPSAENTLDPVHIQTKADYHFALGEAYSLDGDSKRAIEEFKLTTVYDPQAAAVRLRLATEYFRQGLLTESVEQAELGMQIEPDNIEVRTFLGTLYSTLKMYPQAMKQFQFVAERDPKNSEIFEMIGGMYAEQDKYDEAEKYFLKAAAIEGNTKAFAAHYYIGRMHMERGATHFARAEQAFSKALTLKPSFEDAAIMLATLHERQGHKTKAYKLLESFQSQFGPKRGVAFQLSQMFLEEEKYPKALKHLRDLEGFEPNNLNVRVKIALILIEMKNYDEAVVKLEEILAMAPSSDKIRFYLAAVYEELGQYELATSNFEKIESSSTYFADAVVHAAYLHRKRERVDKAEALLVKAIREREDVPQFYAFYATILDDKKDYHAGVELLQKAAKKFPANTQIRYYLGSMYDRIGRSEDTVAEMRKILDVEPDHVNALNYLAYTYAETGKNLEEAEDLARRALRLQPEDGYIMDTVGWVLFKLGRVEEALPYLERAHRMRPEESIIAEHLGDAYYVFELLEKAKEMYLRAVSVEKDQAKINKIRSKIVSLETRPKVPRTPASID